MLEKGYIQVYTGEGKGKTTCAVGLSIRALGAGLKVAFFQFFKPPTSSEVKILKRFFPELYYASFHTQGFVKGNVDNALKEKILKGYELFKQLLKDGGYDLFVLDEFVYALNWNIIDLQEFLKVLERRPPKIEVVITGRFAPQPLIEKADLVTEMRPLKHYLDKGVRARCGIEW
ncbi:cobinamide adenolsyltransferase [Caldimicrobium thiodismutans]|jgi:cob(I)alamin adenosyltransferase|uniref:corrinoid adenosyltransferase n=1 Tax=Caldimicrobium thiodismutans TaxID=1653476 RepID=A0A0U5AP80_9BACT|nr:cob(I)yrinic acid a,c-diamide adenosyltransferase [Caldimicrobium thiodismutans]BAU22641.1 cobinamide adenolsyltransferase [Caldimicrobium thiodismutans]